MKEKIEFLLKNWHIKSISLLLSLLIFAFQQYTNISEITLDIELNLILPKHLVPLSDVPDMIKIKVKTNGKKDKFSEDKIKAVADFSKYTLKGIYEEDIRIENSFDIEEVAEIKKEIDSLTIELDSVKTKEIKIIPVFIDEPSKDYMIDEEYKIHPEEIFATGPESLIDKLDFLNTEPISLKDKYEDFILSAKIQNTYKNIFLSLDYIELNVFIKIKTKIKIFNNVTVIIGSSIRENILIPKRIIGEIQVKGEVDIVSKLNSNNFEIIASSQGVNFNNLSDEIRLRFYPKLPFNNLEVLDYYPSQKTFEVVKKVIKEEKPEEDILKNQNEDEESKESLQIVPDKKIDLDESDENDTSDESSS